jgi:integrase
MPKIQEINSRLKLANLGVSVVQRGDRLYLRATLPPKNHSNLKSPHQQWISLGVYACDAGLAFAETEAYKVGSLLAVKGFSWTLYDQPETCQNWVVKFESDYFQKRKVSPESLTTWKGDYYQILKRLNPDEILTEQTLIDLILSTEPESRMRKRAVMVLSKFAKFCGIDCDLKSYSPKYLKKKTIRDLPDDSLIANLRDSIANESWQWCYGVMACYGLRNHEIFYLDFSDFPICCVLRGKTGFRDVFPIYPEWADQWDLGNVKIPDCSGKNNGELGNRVTHAFIRARIPFNPYSLRHRWAVRSLEFGLDIATAARMMGHSLKVHTDTYHQWINRATNKRIFERLLDNPNRLKPPL